MACRTIKSRSPTVNRPSGGKEIDNEVEGRTDTRSRQAQGHQTGEADQVSDIATDIVEVKETRR